MDARGSVELLNLRRVIPPAGEPGHVAAVREVAAALLVSWPGVFRHAVESRPGFRRPAGGDPEVALQCFDLAVEMVLSKVGAPDGARPSSRSGKDPASAPTK
jgi:hypothetical protein